MSRPDPFRRLHFEQLEAKVSPAAMLPLPAEADCDVTAAEMLVFVQASVQDRNIEDRQAHVPEQLPSTEHCRATDHYMEAVGASDDHEASGIED